MKHLGTSGKTFEETLGSLGTAALRMLPAETAHHAGMKLMQWGAHRWLPSLESARQTPHHALQTEVPGIGPLKHPIGLAAGFDKNATTIPGFVDLGFSFLEVGTVTPQPQAGNPRPRMFRYPESMSLVNRMGFNSDGIDAVRSRLMLLPEQPIPLGINVGKNKTTAEEHAILDYVKGVESMWDYGSYFVVNLSSPNTPGLRDLASRDFLSSLAAELTDKVRKVWVKLDPDMPVPFFQRLIEALGEFGYQGAILSNTKRIMKPQLGGLSGHPLAVAATQRLEQAWDVHQGSLPMIASGGILSGTDIFGRIARGANAVQIYTALVYRGPFAVYQLLRELQAEMELQGMQTFNELHGSFY